jgi:hypothetical protein
MGNLGRSIYNSSYRTYSTMCFPFVFKYFIYRYSLVFASISNAPGYSCGKKYEKGFRIKIRNPLVIR